MTLTIEQVLAMAPDAAATAAGKKLAAPRHWAELGQSDELYWGLCQGSAVYQVKIERATYGYHCSCPSRKFPCKHTLGLLLIVAEQAAALSASEAPEWARDWFSRRQARAEKQAEKKAAGETKPVDEQAQARRAQQRESRVLEGLERIELWMSDRVREGLAGIESQPPSFWLEQAKRLTDAQAPGLASWVSRWSTLAGSVPDWPQRLLDDFGRLQLLVHAYRRLEQLDAGLQSDIRQLVGWNVGQDEVDRDGERVEDDWVVIGQYLDDTDRVRVQRSWLVGRRTGRDALLLQFSAGGQPFPEAIAAGTGQHAVVAYYPGAARQRARFVSRAEVTVAAEPPAGVASCDDFLDEVADGLARQPWTNHFAQVFRGVTFLPGETNWWLRDASGRTLPLARGACWKGLAVSGGAACDVACEWNGYELRPLGLWAGGVYRSL